MMSGMASSFRPPPAGINATPGGAEGRAPTLGRILLVMLGLPKTVYFNLRCLPLRQAIRLPILVSHNVALFDLGGTVTLTGPIRPGMILLGFGAVGAFDYRRSRSVWQNGGEVVFEGPARLGHGFKLSSAGVVTFGPEFVLSAESQIVCRESVSFGRGCLVSWDVLIIDTDFHPLVVDGERTVPNAPIVLGDHAWVGARSSILKGVQLGDDVIVASGAVVTRSQLESNVILGGNPAQVIRDDAHWSHE
jgi:acetyltransferase-like isoleucine patch superfamily enzyme